MKKVISNSKVSLLATLAVVLLTNLISTHAQEVDEFDEPKDVLGAKLKEHKNNKLQDKSQQRVIRNIIDDASNELVALVSLRESPVGDLSVYFSGKGKALAYTLKNYEAKFGGITSLYSYPDSKKIGYATTSDLHDLDGKLACSYASSSLIDKQISLPEKIQLTLTPTLPVVPAFGLISMSASDLTCMEFLGVDPLTE